MVDKASEKELADRLHWAGIYMHGMQGGVDAAIKSLATIYEDAKQMADDKLDSPVTQAYLLGMQHMLDTIQREAAVHDWDESLISMKVEVVKRHDEKHPRGE